MRSNITLESERNASKLETYYKDLLITNNNTHEVKIKQLTNDFANLNIKFSTLQQDSNRLQSDTDKYQERISYYRSVINELSEECKTNKLNAQIEITKVKEEHDHLMDELTAQCNARILSVETMLKLQMNNSKSLQTEIISDLKYKCNQICSEAETAKSRLLNEIKSIREESLLKDENVNRLTVLLEFQKEEFKQQVQMMQSQYDSHNFDLRKNNALRQELSF